MNVMFETQRAITVVEGRIHFAQERARMDAEPVLLPDPDRDGNMAQVGTVIKDQGVYRMWYLCAPADAASDDRSHYRMAYAESDDCRTWRKPDLGLVKDGPSGNNYVDLNVSSVFIDPKASAAFRYRGLVYHPKPYGEYADPKGLGSGFYTAHSPDGLHWELDSRDPRWSSGDTITGVYHPARERGLAAMKYVRLSGGIHRRAIWTAELVNGQWGDSFCALVPADFDDIAARARGFHSTDFYKMGMLPAGQGLVALIENFRHYLPLSMEKPSHYAIYGLSDVTLAYQARLGDCWLHAPGRPSFIGGEKPAWAAGWLEVSNSPVEVGAEHCLFVTGDGFSHAWAYDPNCKVNPRWAQVQKKSGGRRAVGIARWPLWRLFGFYAEPEGVMEIELGELHRPCELALNYKTGAQGALRVQLFARAGRGGKAEIPGRSELDLCVTLTGDALAGVVAWKDGTRVDPVPGKQIVARITMENAVFYAWDWNPV